MLHAPLTLPPVCALILLRRLRVSVFVAAANVLLLDPTEQGSR